MHQIPNLQRLPRVSALLCLEVERFCLRQLALPKRAALVLAVSGGADSTALLHACAQRWPGQVFAIHVHHGLQAAADGFVQQCESTCAVLQVPLARAAVGDEAFFIRDQHPARELLNTVAESGAVWLGDDDGEGEDAE